MSLVPVAVLTMAVFSLFIQVAEGATHAAVPFINRKALGAVVGIVEAGAVAAGFLFKIEGLDTQPALLYLGVCVACSSACALLVRVSPATQAAEQAAREHALAASEMAPAPVALRGTGAGSA